MLLHPMNTEWQNKMYNHQNSEHKPHPPPISPRISFSNDFVDSSSHNHHHLRPPNYRDAPVSSDFEFSVSNYSMMSADELFSKGKILPFKENSRKNTTTLRDELQHQDHEDFSLRPPKNPTRWRGFLGLRKSHIGSKKTNDKGEGSRSTFNHDQCTNNPQESGE